MAGFIRKKKGSARNRGRRRGASPNFLDQKTILSFKRARIKKRLTQGELAKIVGTKQSAISRFESGRYNPSVEFLMKLAKALGKRIEVRLK